MHVCMHMLLLLLLPPLPNADDGLQVEFIYVDNPEGMGQDLKAFFNLGQEDQDVTLEPIKMDPGHIHFSRLGRLMRRNHPLFCKLVAVLVAALPTHLFAVCPPPYCFLLGMKSRLWILHV